MLDLMKMLAHSVFTPTRAMVLLLLLAGAAFEAGHLEHHLRHACQSHDTADTDERACLIFQTGGVVEDVQDLRPAPVAVGLAVASVAVGPPQTDGSLLPESRAPPTSS